MSADFDVIILGAGAAGEHCAGDLADAGLRVAVVERDLVAGECSYWACIPSKTLLRPGEAVAATQAVPGAREAVTGAIDARQALAWRDEMVSGYDDSGQVRWLNSKGITLLRGTGRIAGAGAVEVGGTRYTTTHIVVATGSEPVIPPIPGLREAPGVWTNREATGIREVPQRLIVLGGGPVGVEMAQAVHRLGADAVIVEGQPHLLPREPQELGTRLGDALSRTGIEVLLGVHAESVSHDNNGYRVALAGGTEVQGDRLLVATGRRPRVTGIGLETVGIDPPPRGIPVDAGMAAADGVWAIGDVTGIWPLTYVGKYHARIAAANITGGSAEANFDAVPRVVFTDPQAAAVGAAEAPMSVTIRLSDVPRTATYTARYDMEPWFLTVLSDGVTVTGAYALGPDAGEWLQQLTLAIRARVPLTLLRDLIQPFPTFSESVFYAIRELTSSSPAAHDQLMPIGAM